LLDRDTIESNYDFWLEIYNSSAKDLIDNGMHISDNPLLHEELGSFRKYLLTIRTAIGQIQSDWALPLVERVDHKNILKLATEGDSRAQDYLDIIELFDNREWFEHRRQ